MKYAGILILLLGLSFSVQSQDKNVVKKEKEIKQSLTSQREVKVSIESDGNEKHYVIKIADDSGEPEIIEWKGTGKLPDEIQQRLDELDIDITMDDDQDLDHQQKFRIAKVKKRTSDGTGDDIEQKIMRRTEGKDREIRIWIDQEGNHHKLDRGDQAEVELDHRRNNEKIYRLRSRPSEQKMRQDLTFKELELQINPDRSNLQLNFQTASLPVTVKLSDSRGNTIYLIKKQEFAGSFIKEFDISKEKGRMLILTIEQDGKFYKERVSLHPAGL